MLPEMAEVSLLVGEASPKRTFSWHLADTTILDWLCKASFWITTQHWSIYYESIKRNTKGCFFFSPSEKKISNQNILGFWSSIQGISQGRGAYSKAGFMSSDVKTRILHTFHKLFFFSSVWNTKCFQPSLQPTQSTGPVLGKLEFCL